MSNKTQLEVGDKIYISTIRDISGVLVVERVTSTMAFAKEGGYKFKREIGTNGRITKIGGGKSLWSTTSYYLETDELKNQLKRRENIEKLKHLDFIKLTDEQIEAAIKLFGL